MDQPIDLTQDDEPTDASAVEPVERKKRRRSDLDDLEPLPTSAETRASQRLAEVEGRLDRLRRLCRKYGPRVEDVLDEIETRALLTALGTLFAGLFLFSPLTGAGTKFAGSGRS